MQESYITTVRSRCCEGGGERFAILLKVSSEKPWRFRGIDRIATSPYSAGSKACTSGNIATWPADNFTRVAVSTSRSRFPLLPHAQ